jgi:hypothetical protein
VFLCIFLIIPVINNGIQAGEVTIIIGVAIAKIGKSVINYPTNQLNSDP